MFTVKSAVIILFTAHPMNKDSAKPNIYLLNCLRISRNRERMSLRLDFQKLYFVCQIVSIQLAFCIPRSSI